LLGFLYWNIITTYGLINIKKKLTGTLHEDLFTLMIISDSVLLRMRNVSDKSCRENQNTHVFVQ